MATSKALITGSDPWQVLSKGEHSYVPGNEESAISGFCVSKWGWKNRQISKQEMIPSDKYYALKLNWNDALHSPVQLNLFPVLGFITLFHFQAFSPTLILVFN